MIIYTATVLITTIIAAIYQTTTVKYKKPLFLCMVLFPAIISGLREVGTDYFLYLDRFRSISSGLALDITQTELSGSFYVLLGVLNKVGFSYQAIIFLVSIITTYIAFFLICQYEKNINVAMAVFSYMTMFYYLSFNIFRQCLATEIFALAFYYVLNKKRTLGILLLLCAILVHSATLPYAIGIPLIIWIGSSKNKKKRTNVYIALALSIFMLPELSMLTRELSNIFPHYAFYFLNFHYRNIGIGVLRYVLLVFCVIHILRRYGYSESRLYESYVFISIVGAILTWLSYVSDTYIYRIGYIGLVYVPIIHGFFAKQFLLMTKSGGTIQIKYKKSIAGKMAGGFVVMLFVLLFFFFWYDFIYLNSGEILPYRMNLMG